MQICKLPTYQTICERISCRKGLVQLHILTSATMTCCFNLSAASFSLLTKKALTFPAPQCFCENGTCVILATILATVGAQKVLFAQLVNTRRSPFEDGPKNSPLIFFKPLYRTMQPPPPQKKNCIIRKQFSAHRKVAAAAVFLEHSAASHLLAHFSSFVLNLQPQL